MDKASQNFPNYCHLPLKLSAADERTQSSNMFCLNKFIKQHQSEVPSSTQNRDELYLQLQN